MQESATSERQRRLSAFLERTRRLTPRRDDDAFYEGLKRDLMAECPDLESDEYQRAIRVIAKAAGV